MKWNRYDEEYVESYRVEWEYTWYFIVHMYVKFSKLQENSSHVS